VDRNCFLVYHETFFSSKLRTTPSIWPGTQLFDKIEDKPASIQACLYEKWPHIHQAVQKSYYLMTNTP
jgi:hypothetical protein